MAFWLHAAYVVLGLFATLFALVVASFGSDLGETGTKVCALIATASAGIMTAFDIGGKGNALRKSWRQLNCARILYENDPSYTLEKLVSIYAECEENIGFVTYNNLTKKAGTTKPET